MRESAIWTLGVVAVLFVAFLVLGISLPSAGGPARRTQSLNNLHNMSVGAQNMASGQGNLLPRGTLRNEANVPLHGWPAQLLPYVDARSAHEIVDFEKPWDHPDNARAMAVLPFHFYYHNEPQVDAAGRGLIHYAMNSHVVGDREPLTLDEIEQGDGLASTILMGEVNTGYRPWGHPFNSRDPAAGFGRTAKQFGNPEIDDVAVVFCDGGARHLNADIDPKVLRALATWNGGEPVDLDP